MSSASPNDPSTSNGARGTPPPSRELGDVLGVALRAGQLMMENGANAQRVELVVARVAHALGADRVDVQANPSGLIATAAAGRDHRTRILRVTKTGIDLNRMACVRALADRLEVTPAHPDEVREELERIAAAGRLYPLWLTALLVGVACGSFALLFGGGPREALAAATGAGVGEALRGLLGKRFSGRLIITFVISACASAIALGLATLLAADLRIAMAASVLLLIPGVLMVSSVGDLLRGYAVSGLARAAIAGLVVLTIGAGLATTLAFQGSELLPSVGARPGPLWAAGLALVATVGFAILFDVPRRLLPLSALIGMMGYAARDVGLWLELPPEPAVFAGGVMIAAASELASRPLRLPSNLFTIPAFIPLVPGVAAFQVVLFVVARDFTAATAGLIETGMWLGALGAGVGLVQGMVRPK